MGNWNITVRGIGIHHNGRPDDAEAMAKVFVQSLKAAGHQILGATVTYGGEENVDVAPPPAPPASSSTGG